jgi:hypothetical protein
MPIPTRARTSALGGYVTGHGKFMWYHAVDAMDWVLWTAIREYEFDQETEDEIPII